MNYNKRNKPRQIWRWRGYRAAVSSALLLLFCGVDAFEYSSRPISSVLTRRHSTCTSVNINGYPRHQLALAKKDDTTSEEEHRKKGRKGFATVAQQMVDSGEADTLKEAHSLIGSRGSRAAAQKLVDKGEAATIKEAKSMMAARMREAFNAKYTKEERSEKRQEIGRKGSAIAAQKLVESGEATTIKEAVHLQLARAREAAFQKLVNNGEAATIKEAKSMTAARMREAFNAKYTKEERQEIGRKGSAIAAQNLIDSGEAATLAEALSLLGSRGNRAAAQKLVNNGEAETIEEAYQLQAARAREAFKDKYTEKEIAELSKKAGVIGAIKQGKYTNYPGVSFDKPSGKWRVRVCIKGKRVHVGYYFSEIEAAKAHDEFVRKHGLDRPLHFPRKGETSSQSSTIQPRSAGEKNN